MLSTAGQHDAGATFRTLQQFQTQHSLGKVERRLLCTSAKHKQLCKHNSSINGTTPLAG